MKTALAFIVAALLATTAVAAEPEYHNKDSIRALKQQCWDFFKAGVSDNPPLMKKEAFIWWHRKDGEPEEVVHATIMLVVSESAADGSQRISRVKTLPIDTDFSFDFAAVAEQHDPDIVVWTKAGRVGRE